MRLDELELDQPPYFEIGEKVKVRKLIKNDGTFPGVDLGKVLANIGDVGYIVSIGTYLQKAYIYAVHFIETGFVVGCRKYELESQDYIEEEEENS